jgi:hypothetical protein
MTDFYATHPAGADISIVWLDDGGAFIRVGGDQPMDQPPCSIRRSREEMAALRDHLDAELGVTAPQDGSRVILWDGAHAREGWLRR